MRKFDYFFFKETVLSLFNIINQLSDYGNIAHKDTKIYDI